jgi:predicted phosphodiesterase
MRTLLVSDLHLDDAAENLYRWNIFNQILNVVKKENVNKVYILGDLTDKKDKHTSTFINKLLDNLLIIKENVAQMILLAGNHDYTDQNLPFLTFINKIGIKCVAGKELIIDKEIFLPHVRNPLEVYKNIDFTKFNTIYTHLDIKGSRLDNGMKSLDGIPLSFFKNTLTFSGHIHKGQKIGENTYYVGSPYATSYEKEDTLHRGILFLDSVNIKDVYFDFPKKITKRINNINDIDTIDSNNLYKYIIELDKSNISDVVDIREALKNKHVKIDLRVKAEYNKIIINKVDYFKSYCINNSVAEELINIGDKIINGK